MSFKTASFKKKIPNKLYKTMLFSPTIQTILTLLLVALAVGYAAYRIYLTVKEAGNPCHGCSGCELGKALKGKHINRAKGNCTHTKPPSMKKNVEKKCR